MKFRSIKTKESLVKYKTVTDIDLKLTGNESPHVLNETTPETERNKMKVARFKNSPTFSVNKFFQSHEAIDKN